jgi:XTP/dITP diphosphohydrolase
MQKIVLASSNKGKFAEIQALLQGFAIELIPQTALQIPDIEETGLTFVENAILKARNAAQLSGLPALADDSGLAVDCLNGAPGVYSARYAGPGANDADLIEKLLKEMQKVDCGNRSARYHCVMALLNSPTDPSPLICHGIWEGAILLSGRGAQGFGYDPVFYVPTHDCSAAELDPAEKNRISHRGNAMRQFMQLFR